MAYATRTQRVVASSDVPGRERQSSASIQPPRWIWARHTDAPESPRRFPECTSRLNRADSFQILTSTASARSRCVHPSQLAGGMAPTWVSGGCVTSATAWAINATRSVRLAGVSGASPGGYHGPGSRVAMAVSQMATVVALIWPPSSPASCAQLIPGRPGPPQSLLGQPGRPRGGRLRALGEAVVWPRTQPWRPRPVSS